MSDPYKVLGVPSSATDDEVKKAYRNLSRRYHPDANVDNPDKDKAEEMFKLVQQAYEQIMEERTNGAFHGGGTHSSGQSSYGGFYGGYQDSYAYGDDQEAARMRAAVNFIQSMQFKQATVVLNSIPTDNRSAQWYYLSAIANSGLNNNITAMEHAQRAVNMDPANVGYRQLLERLQYGGTWYTRGQGYYGMPMETISCNTTRACCSLLCLTQFCMGGFCGRSAMPLILCC